MHPFLSHLIARIYDCAVDPSGWDTALGQLRDRLELAYVGLNAVAFPADDGPCPVLVRGTEWDPA